MNNNRDTCMIHVARTMLLAMILPGMILLGTAVAHAQDTFSIVAIDTETGEVGSAGASCLGIDVSLISDVQPGVGAINTQALHEGVNAEYASTLMREGHTPRQIIDSLVAHDVFSAPAIRQYGVVTLAGDVKSAAYTGINCMDYKGHIIGPTYAIQGNILLGRHILDSMEARFLRTEGKLYHRLMAALQGANVTGADTRCAKYGTSSLSAFLRVARPGDDPERLLVDLRVTIPDGSREPIDSLENVYHRWLVTGMVVEDDPAGASAGLEIHPNPAPGVTIIRYMVPATGIVRLVLYDLQGKEVASLLEEKRERGEHEYRFDAGDFPQGTYYCRLSAAGRVITQRLVLEGER